MTVHSINYEYASQPISNGTQLIYVLYSIEVLLLLKNLDADINRIYGTYSKNLLSNKSYWTMKKQIMVLKKTQTIQ